jgi:hypothetical protein
MKERNLLLPGRLLMHRRKFLRKDPYRLPTEELDWQLCMVVAQLPGINRRHARSQARRNGWTVIIMLMGGPSNCHVETLVIYPDDQNWKFPT